MDFIKEQFFQSYGHEPDAVYFAPSRINLIGEHIDYNGGLVLPCAVDMGTFLAVSPANTNVLNLKSGNFPSEIYSQNSYGSFRPVENSWVTYPLGIFDYMARKNYAIPGLNLLYSGNIPIGSGLSSSASIEVVTAFMLNNLLEINWDRREIALVSQEVENNFVGVNCGIMDQYAIANGIKDMAMLLDCHEVNHKPIPINLGDFKLLIINSMKPRSLITSKYNERRQTCESALVRINAYFQSNYPNLCSLPFDAFEQAMSILTPEMQKRVKHVLTENHRVHQAVKTLSEGDLVAFGKLINASHQSLRELYEVTGSHMDAIHDISNGLPGVLGCRMIGGGFGGCAIALVHTDAVNEYRSVLTKEYKRLTGLDAEIYAVKIVDGVMKIC